MTAVKVNGVFSYLVQDSLKSVSVALNASGSVTATALYAPYGVVRYSSGTMPTSYGYTDQRLDGSGLSYYHARYYDSTVGQFTSADVVQGPNRYAYVGGNPETCTDPTGNFGCSTSAPDGMCGGRGPSPIGNEVSNINQTVNIDPSPSSIPTPSPAPPLVVRSDSN